jgi:hypothetical protein
VSIAERFRFHKRKQLEGESINDYVAVLRKLAEHCDFGDRLADDLRDRLVGILTFSTHGLIIIASFAFLLTLYIP